MKANSLKLSAKGARRGFGLSVTGEEESEEEIMNSVTQQNAIVDLTNWKFTNPG